MLSGAVSAKTSIHNSVCFFSLYSFSISSPLVFSFSYCLNLSLSLPLILSFYHCFLTSLPFLISWFYCNISAQSNLSTTSFFSFLLCLRSTIFVYRQLMSGCWLWLLVRNELILSRVRTLQLDLGWLGIWKQGDEWGLLEKRFNRGPSSKLSLA